MEIEEFEEIFNTIYIAKKLYDIGRYDLVTQNFYDMVCLDAYYENMYSLIPELFAYYRSSYNEYRGMEIHVLSDPVIVDFYTLAGEYGRKHKIADEVNPYIKEAEQEVRRQLNFSYCLDWRLKGYTNPKRPFHSRLALFVYQDEWVDLGCLAYGLIEIYEWFSDACAHLKEILHEKEPAVVQYLGGEVIAA
ncbi:MAG: hypothetical protein NC548_58765 [Lachnospiraceae bacterium]|nr:hypothetical protein [Acetatifactor muris]MCM1224334.1 hypothetical protein [Lachnospiraceae bacterium]